MKQLCFVLNKFIFGGIEKVAINYLTHLDYSKYNVDVIILGDVEDMINQIPSQCNVYEMKLSYYAMPESRASTMNKKNAGALIYYPTYLLKKCLLPYYRFQFRKFRNKKYDVAIAFSGHLNDMYFVSDILNADKKIIWTHGMIYQYLLLSPAFEKGYKKFDTIACINHLDQNEIFNHKPYLNYDIVNIYNPVPDEKSKVNEVEVNNLKKRFGRFLVVVSRISWPKDPITVVRAYNSILKEYPDFTHNLVFVGDGDDRIELEFYVNKHNLSSRVFFEGSKVNVVDYYKAAEISILSSENEGLPTVLIEAMGFGTPVIASNSPWGCEDILQSGQFGLLFPVGDYEKLKIHIVNLLKDKDYYDHYVKMGLHRFQDFNPETILAQFYDLIEKERVK